MLSKSFQKVKADKSSDKKDNILKLSVYYFHVQTVEWLLRTTVKV